MTSSLRDNPISGRYCVIIPAYEAEKTVGAVVRGVKALGLDVVVVDDGSRDKTAAAASREGAVVISHLNNQGKGSALKTGFDYSRRMNYDGVVTMDSDGQHYADDVPALIHAGEVQHAGLVLGNRMSNGNAMPGLRRQTNRLMSAVVSAVAGQPIADSQSGLRMIRRELLEAVPVRCRRFDIETEMLLAAAAHRWKIVSVAVKTSYAPGQRSHIRPVYDGLRFVWVILRHLLGMGR